MLILVNVHFNEPWYPLNAIVKEIALKDNIIFTTQ